MYIDGINDKIDIEKILDIILIFVLVSNFT